MKNLLTRIADLILGGPSRRSQKPLPEILFHPVIFANGSDDDAEGLKAFFENRPYIFGGDLYGPTAGPRRLVNLNLTLSKTAIVFIKDGRVHFIYGCPSGDALTVSISHGFDRHVNSCRITLGAKVEP
ncbi:hypothetical protein CFBP6625_06705 [Agrobacterium tumefaciens]|nr:hypothetical protein CFBP6625_06705 [Agrobacterium tumefaciens]